MVNALITNTHNTHLEGNNYKHKYTQTRAFARARYSLKVMDKEE